MQQTTRGWLNGFIGVVIFSGSLPATRAAVADFNPVFLTSVRATIAALLGLALLLVFQVKVPKKQEIIPLYVVALGTVVGFPLLTALALEHITAAHSIVFLGVLPLATATFAVLRAGEKPPAAFWLFSCLGSCLVVGFAITPSLNTQITDGLSASPLGNAYMIAAVIICGLGYAEGAKLSRRLGGWQVISWSLLLSLPIMAPLAFFSMPLTFDKIGQPAWLGLVYVSAFSMLIGFVFWYRGLAQGGIAAVGQLQLLQPFFGLALAATLLQETIGAGMIGVSLMVMLSVAAAKHFAP